LPVSVGFNAFSYSDDLIFSSKLHKRIDSVNQIIQNNSFYRHLDRYDSIGHIDERKLLLFATDDKLYLGYILLVDLAVINGVCKLRLVICPFDYPLDILYVPSSMVPSMLAFPNIFKVQFDAKPDVTASDAYNNDTTNTMTNFLIESHL
jgi:hypothetical protein